MYHDIFIPLLVPVIKSLLKVIHIPLDFIAATTDGITAVVKQTETVSSATIHDINFQLKQLYNMLLHPIKTISGVFS